VFPAIRAGRSGSAATADAQTPERAEEGKEMLIAQFGTQPRNSEYGKQTPGDAGGVSVLAKEMANGETRNRHSWVVFLMEAGAGTFRS
jgi:Flp pilus assembly CpaF family ATPase